MTYTIEKLFIVWVIIVFCQFFVFKHEKKFLIVEVFMAYFYWKLAIMGNSISVFVGLFCSCFFSWILYGLCLDLMEFFKISDPDMYKFKILRGDDEMAKNSYKHCCFFVAYTCVIVTLCLNSSQSENWCIISGMCGYTLYRVWILVLKWQSKQGYAHFFCFPLFNVFSSSFLMLTLTILLEGQYLFEFAKFLFISS